MRFLMFGRALYSKPLGLVLQFVIRLFTFLRLSFDEYYFSYGIQFFNEEKWPFLKVIRIWAEVLLLHFLFSALGC